MIETNLPVPSDRTQGDRRFLITMVAKQNGDMRIRSCEVISEQFRNRTSFGFETSLETVLAPELAAGIRATLDKLSFKTEVLALPHFLLEVPGLTLQGVRIMSTAIEEGTVNIIMRFSTFIGGISRALAVPIGFEASVPEAQQAIATQVFEDIAGPLLNICTTAAMGLEDTTNKLGVFGKRIAAHSNEIMFRTTLLKRFIDGCGVGLQRAPIREPVENRHGQKAQLSKKQDALNLANARRIT